MRNLLVILFLVFLISCGSSVPRDVLPPAKMQTVLYDMMQADELANYYSEKDSATENVHTRESFYKSVLSLHKIDKQNFKRSLEYYENHPAVLKTIMDSLQSYVQRVKEGDTLPKPNHPLPKDTTRRKPPFPLKPL